MELHIEGQNVEVWAEMRDMIAQRLEKLDTHHGDIIHARVALVKSVHHQHGSDEARISLSMNRRKVLRVAKVGKTLESAVSDALETVQRELSSYRAKRRERSKPRLQTAPEVAQATGTVARVFSEQGYGWVDIGEDEDVHFLRQVVVGNAFDSIAEGASVEVELTDGPNGYEATRVVPLGG